MRISEGTVIVTGATRGIGRATVEAILERGGKVVGIARDGEALRALEAAFSKAHVFITEAHQLGGLESVVYPGNLNRSSSRSGLSSKVSTVMLIVSGRFVTWVSMRCGRKSSPSFR